MWSWVLHLVRTAFLTQCAALILAVVGASVRSQITTAQVVFDCFGFRNPYSISGGSRHQARARIVPGAVHRMARQACRRWQLGGLMWLYQAFVFMNTSFRGTIVATVRHVLAKTATFYVSKVAIGHPLICLRLSLMLALHILKRCEGDKCVFAGQIPILRPSSSHTIMATAARAHYLQFDIQWSSIALLYYDYALTFPTELEHMWKADRFRLSTVLYIFCRYAIPANVLYLLAVANKLEHSCDSWYKVVGAISVIGRAAVITVFMMRTYAVCGRNRWILYGLGAIGVTCVVLDCLHVPGLRCHGSSSIQIANTLLSILVCVFESSATALTIIRSVQALKARAPGRARTSSFSYLVLEQGLLYFSIVSVFTIAAAVLNFRAPGGFFQRLLNALTLPLSGLLTARFLLHLRAWNSTSVIRTGSQAHTIEDRTLGSFHAAEGAVKTIIDEFGQDPVHAAALGNDQNLVEQHQLEEIVEGSRHSDSDKSDNV